MEPWSYTLRELLWRAEAVRHEAWEHTAWLTAVVLSAASGEVVDPQNPLDAARNPPPAGNIESLRGFFTNGTL